MGPLTLTAPIVELVRGFRGTFIPFADPFFLFLSQTEGSILSSQFSVPDKAQRSGVEQIFRIRENGV